MKILSIFAILSLPLFADDIGEGAAPAPGTSAGGYTPTVYNKNYSKGFLGKDANPTEELEAMYPQSSYTLSSQEDPKKSADSRTTGSDFTGAKSQANYWLSLLDQRAYSASYAQAGGLLQDIVSGNIWTAAMKEVRGSFGNNTSRKVTGHHMVSKLPHGTKGKFMVIKFDSTFSSKGKVEEQVTLIQQGNRGQWKVISYKVGS
ncbi:MAG: hypothetical protein S4CHLAM81_13060 [Chlamydiales bacterium]|nr:hypothetical protein [Chlamydiales bacterium]MCH9636080.1 hypothetical protein [Chlamydiales bacterium]MCH9704477.1 DUF4019 domain-containing protein [Chlamydiota bacterium]